jgi:hypothetical protein
MRKIQILGLLVGVFAFAAIAVASASAAPEWLLNGSAASKVAVSTTGTLTLEDTGAKTSVECNGTFVGTVGPGAADEITLVEDLEAKDVTKANEGNATTGWLDCKIVTKGICEEATGALVKVFPLHLPWITTLALNANATSGFVDNISNSESNPGYEVKCHVIGIEAGDTCTGNTGGEAANGTSDVTGTFSANELITPHVSCTVGGAKTGKNTGTGLTESSSGTLSISGEA